jgi:hypothetical protein
LLQIQIICLSNISVLSVTWWRLLHYKVDIYVIIIMVNLYRLKRKLYSFICFFIYFCLFTCLFIVGNNKGVFRWFIKKGHWPADLIMENRKATHTKVNGSSFYAYDSGTKTGRIIYHCKYYNSRHEDMSFYSGHTIFIIWFRTINTIFKIQVIH